MILQKNQLVVFPDGHKEGYLEARWSTKHQCFYSFNEDGEKIYSTVIEEKPVRKNKKFVPGPTTCTKQIFPCGETEKSYRLNDGSNGKITRGNMRVYYKYIAKSICYIDENGNIFAPIWAE